MSIELSGPTIGQSGVHIPVATMHTEIHTQPHPVLTNHSNYLARV